MHEQEGDNEPAHHARRPMNAFLIFCKRHRSVVRDKYPNLENRSITKILGEWWANLDKEEKSAYTNLAKQYKDAFFSANPDFKWYKLPAPPLRTLTSRPRELHPPPPEYEPELEKTNNNSTKLDLNKKTVQLPAEDNDKSPSMFTPGKLADEANMGGLSSLLAVKTENPTPNPYYSPPSYKYNQISYINDARNPETDARAPNIKELQNALSETSRVFENFEERNQKVYYNDFTNQDVINQIVDKRYSKDDEYDYKERMWSEHEEPGAKSGRSCKGKRYQKFMAVGGLIVNKRPKKETDANHDDAFSASCSWEPSSNIEETIVTDDNMHENYIEFDVEIKNEAPANKVDDPEPDPEEAKPFRAADFDLDAKIKALPSLSLEKFQERKRENKKKKKTVHPKTRPDKSFTSETSYSAPAPIEPDYRKNMAEKWRETVIGSQKRKPRKISITRLEINSFAPSPNFVTRKISPEIKFATEAPNSMVQGCQSRSRHDAFSPGDGGDLFALATLAEVAANTSKMEDNWINMAAKATEDNTSTVLNTN